MNSLGSIPDSFGLGDVWSVSLGTTLPQSIIGRRAEYDELIWDADSGFAGNWVGRSSLGGDGTVGYTMLLARRAYSAAGLALFSLVAGGGGSTLAGDVTGAAGANTVVKVQGKAIAAPTTTGDVPHYDGTGIVWAAPSAGSGDVVGPAGAVADRIATYNATTGKLIKDGGKTLTDVANDYAAAITAAVAAVTWQTPVDLNFTQMTPASLANGVNTISGKTVTGVNIASGATSAAIGSNGLRIVNNTTNTDFYAAARSAPLFEWLMTDVFPTFSVSANEVRVYGLINSNANATFEHSRLTLETVPSTVNVRSFWSFSVGQGSGGQELSAEQCRTTTVTAVAAQATTITRKAVCLVRLRSGEVFFYSKDVSANPDTDSNSTVFGSDLSTWTLDATSRPSNTTMVAGSDTLVSNPGSLKILFSSQTVNTAGHQIGDLKRLRIQVR